jgi:restriction system protein
MTVPTYDRFIDPILRFLAANPEGAAARDVHEAAATALGLTEDDRQETLPSGAQQVFKNRAGWAHDRLKRAGLFLRPLCWISCTAWDTARPVPTSVASAGLGMAASSA